jgi:hypothetical protein
MLNHLRIAIPAVAAAVWAVQRLLHHRGPDEASEAPAATDQDEGEEVSLELPAPAKGSAQLPFPAPPPLKAVLLDVELPISLAALWLAMFHNNSSLLANFHQDLGDLDISISPWRQKDDVRRRVLRYTTPLKNPLGPRQARNTEVLEAAQLSGQGFTLRARCTSEGVPFASCFANHVQWVATPHGAHSSRLVVTGECRFHSPVWGPLKGQIERESIKGMSKAYRTLIRMMERNYGGTATPPSSSAGASGSQAAGGGKAGSGKLTGRPVSLVAAAGGAGEEESMNISALLQNPQTNAAAFLALVVFMAILWRLAAMNPMISQAVRGVATAAVGR